MKRKFDIPALLLFVLVLASCGGRRSAVGAGQGHADFPSLDVPSVYSDPAMKQEYILMHYWDNLAGVEVDQTEEALSNYIAMLDMVPLSVAQQSVEVMFDRICQAEQADSTAHYYVLMTQMVSKYLYDPNSPLRNEDYYLPFVRLMADSPYTSEDMRPAYRYEAESCAICQGGTVAPDFVFRTIDGRDSSLHAIESHYTVMVFSNPGCEACKEVIEEIMSIPGIAGMMSDRVVTVINVYIDDDLDGWRSYSSYYPEAWINACDRDGVIRGTRIYDVRAIPSVYLLGPDKTVIYKDAPVSRIERKILNP